MNEILEMEKVVLGVLLSRPDLVPETLDRIPPTEWSGPHVTIAECLLGMADMGEEIDPQTVMVKLRNAGLLNRIGGGATLISMVQANYAAGEASVYVDALEGESKRRQIRRAGMRIVQRAENVTNEPEEILTAAIDELAEIGHSRTQVETMDWPEGDTDPEPDWVIPGLLAVDERVMFTGGEGLGKSMLIRQFAAAVAVGHHPFGPQRFEPAVALHVDLENPRSITDGAYRRIRNGLTGEGIDLPAGKLHRLEPRVFHVENGRDVSWLMRAVRALQPRLIAIGPVKNMSGMDLDKEENAVRLHTVLNMIRAETQAVLIVEGHAGHSSRGEEGDWRPRGSSSFLGWPEYGFGMKPVSFQPVRQAELVTWRGARVEGRYWPQYLAAGTTWPWVEDPRAAERRG